MNNNDKDRLETPAKASQQEFLLDIFLTLCLLFLFAKGAKEMLEKEFDTWADNYPPFDE